MREMYTGNRNNSDIRFPDCRSEAGFRALPVHGCERDIDFILSQYTRAVMCKLFSDKHYRSLIFSE